MEGGIGRGILEGGIEKGIIERVLKGYLFILRDLIK
jgi:hypothetical protein